MCQYSSAPSGPDVGALADWHIATLGHYAIKGATLPEWVLKVAWKLGVDVWWPNQFTRHALPKN